MSTGSKLLVAMTAWNISVSMVMADQTGDVARGRAQAERICAECHSLDPSVVRTPQGRPASFRMIANTPGMTATALEVWFRTPHPTMPNLVIAESDRNDLAAYIMSFKDR